ncbi:MAG: divalent-cation tolerance protein CutA [Candidatus Micrarchaeota archaeon]|nr:divalent-cation tolerance protein CutA [Candidatus Micrarchaeota archaeon]
MLVMLTTCPDKKSAEKVAKTLVEECYAACVNIINVENSIYMWKGKLKQDPEYMLLIKSKKGFREMESKIREIHPYKIPELISLSVETESRDYLSWVIDCCHSKQGKK